MATAEKATGCVKSGRTDIKIESARQRGGTRRRDDGATGKWL